MNKKLIKSIISLLCCLVLGFTFVACTPEEATLSSEAYEEFIDTYVDTVNKEEISDSEYSFISNGLSDYKIVISNNSYSGNMELKAASEINFFLKDSHNIILDIVKDSEIDMSTYNPQEDRYISIGYTSIFYQSDMADEITFDVLGNDGYLIRTYGKVVVINAYGNNGIIYGAYGFLERNLDYRYYAKDEWRISKEPNIKLKNMDVVAVPDFDSRILDTQTANDRNTDWNVRLRHHGRNAQYSGMEGGAWIGNDMSICSQFLQPAKYLKDHPSWYYRDGGNKSGQLCYTTALRNEPEYDSTAGTEIRPIDEMLKNIIQNYIIKNPTARVLMFGINDNEREYCTCTDCVKEYSTIRNSGQLCLFLNVMRKAINDWQAGATHFPGGTPIPEELQVKEGNDHYENSKKRNILVAFFAYVYCIEAPVYTEEDAEEGKIPSGYNVGDLIQYDAPYEVLGGNGVTGDGDTDDVKLMDGINVRIAHLWVENMHTQYDEEYNLTSAVAFRDWSKMTNSLSVWDYGTSFWDYIAPYPDWSTIKDNMIFYRAMGVKEILTQLPAHTSGTSFYAMMIYVRAQLMWDADQDIEWLYKDFMYNYYGPQAYEHIYAYFTFLRNYFQMADATYIDENGDEQEGFFNVNGVRLVYHGKIYQVFSVGGKFYPYATTLQLKKFFTDAEASIEAVKNTEPKYQKYYDRVQIEALFVHFMELKNFSSYYDTEQLLDMLDNFEYYADMAGLTSITSNASGQRETPTAFVSAMRQSLLQKL